MIDKAKLWTWQFKHAAKRSLSLSRSEQRLVDNVREPLRWLSGVPSGWPRPLGGMSRVSAI